jgi:hypothetical protein
MANPEVKKRIDELESETQDLLDRIQMVHLNRIKLHREEVAASVYEARLLSHFRQRKSLLVSDVQPWYFLCNFLPAQCS